MSERGRFPLPSEERVRARLRRCDRSQAGALQLDEFALFFQEVVGSGERAPRAAPTLAKRGALPKRGALSGRAPLDQRAPASRRARASALVLNSSQAGRGRGRGRGRGDAARGSRGAHSGDAECGGATCGGVAAGGGRQGGAAGGDGRSGAGASSGAGGGGEGPKPEEDAREIAQIWEPQIGRTPCERRSAMHAGVSPRECCAVRV